MSTHRMTFRSSVCVAVLGIAALVATAEDPIPPVLQTPPDSYRYAAKSLGTSPTNKFTRAIAGRFNDDPQYDVFVRRRGAQLKRQDGPLGRHVGLVEHHPPLADGDPDAEARPLGGGEGCGHDVFIGRRDLAGRQALLLGPDLHPAVERGGGGAGEADVDGGALAGRVAHGQPALRRSA